MNLTKNLNKIVLINKWFSNSFMVSSKTLKNDHWRTLRENPNAFGPLTNLPDYSYVDGRPTPIGSRLNKRLNTQRESTQKIVTMCKELDFAKDRYAQIQKEKLESQKKRLKNQLKPKGHLLLKKS